MKTYIIYEYKVDENADFNTPINITSEILTLNDKQNVMDFIEDNWDITDKQRKKIKVVFEDKDVHVFHKNIKFLSFLCRG